MNTFFKGTWQGRRWWVSLVWAWWSWRMEGDTCWQQMSLSGRQTGRVKGPALLMLVISCQPVPCHPTTRRARPAPLLYHPSCISRDSELQLARLEEGTALVITQASFEWRTCLHRFTWQWFYSWFYDVKLDKFSCLRIVYLTHPLCMWRFHKCPHVGLYPGSCSNTFPSFQPHESKGC